MKLLFIAVGKRHDDLYRAAIEEFCARIARYSPAEWIFVASSSKEKEGAEILAKIKDGDACILLDEGGIEPASEKLADLIESAQISGKKRLAFVIGGSYGISPAVRLRADQTISFSRMTFPHQLMRLLLSEQVYRACTILRNEPYHHA